MKLINRVKPGMIIPYGLSINVPSIPCRQYNIRLPLFLTWRQNTSFLLDEEREEWGTLEFFWVRHVGIKFLWIPHHEEYL